MSYQSPNGGVFWKVFIAFFILVSVGFVLFGNQFTATQEIHDRVFSEGIINKNDGHVIVAVPEEEHSWCRQQRITVSEDVMEPLTHSILGWDSANDACVTEYTGFSCVLNKTVTVTYAYTGVIGGTIVWLLADGFYEAPHQYKDYVADLQKEFIPQAKCLEGLYE